MASKFLSLLEGKEYLGEIVRPIDNPKIVIIESCFDGTVGTDWMHLSSPYLLSDKAVEDWTANYSGLDKWWVVSGYPMLGDHNRYEWRLRR